MSGLINKAKVTVDKALHKDKTHDTTHTGTTGTYGSDPTGPHDSHLGNKVDPRVDSDHYGSTGNTAGAGGVGTGQYGSSTGTHGTTGGLTGSSHAHGSDPTGPHDSRLANKADPRVDSDQYGAAGNTSGAGGYGTGEYGSSGTTGGLTGGSHNTHGTSGYSDPTGPHDSHLANKADPRVDSDRYGAAGNTAGAGGYGTGQYGSNTGTHTGTTGSGLTGSHGTHPESNVGSGNSNKTAGPHNSDLLNKIDPRVDSDLDGGKTYGGNKTYQ